MSNRWRRRSARYKRGPDHWLIRLPLPAPRRFPPDTRAPAPLTLASPRVLIPFVIISLIWGSTWIVIRDQLSVVPASWSVTYRFLIAGSAMFALAAWQARRSGEGVLLDWRALVFTIALGLMQFCLNFNFVYQSEHYITSGIVAVIFALLIVPNTMLSRAFLGTVITRRFLAGASIAVVGIGLLLAHEARAISGDASAVTTGVTLTLIAVLCASIANVMMASQIARAQPLFALLAWSMLWGTIFNAAFAFATVGPPVVDWRAGYLGGVAYLGIMGSVVCFPLYLSIIRNVGAGPAAWSGVVVPMVAMALSTLLEGYDWSGLAIAGTVLALAGLIVALRPAGQASD
ncbi:MAG: EamA family transporter [Sphingomonadales bacterium]|nr:EamA family transporter [Sphingomonadales bacterium]